MGRAVATELGVAYLSLSASSGTLAKDVRRELGSVEDAVEGSGKRSGNKFGGALAKGLKRTAQGAGLAAGALIGTAVVKGFGRLRAIDDARGSLRGLGHDASAVDAIMADALKSVKGTAFGLGEAASTAAGAVAAGIKPGKELAANLTLVGDAATIGNTSMTEMGSIFNKVATAGKVQADVFNQLHDRGIPIVQMLSKELGVSGAEVTELARKGQIDFATFSAAMKSGLGGAAQEGGKTFSGAWANTMAALGRIGASAMSGLFARMPEVFASVITVLDGFTPKAEAFGAMLADTFSRLPEVWAKVGPTVTGVVDNLRAAFDHLVPAAQDMAASFGPVATMIGGALVAGVVALSVALVPVASLLRSTATFVRQNRTAIMALVVGVGSAVLAYQGYLLVMKGAALATKAWAAAQSALNFVMSMNPLGRVILVISALVAALVYAYKNSETFRNVVQGAFRGVQRVAGLAIAGVIRILRGWLNVHLSVAGGILNAMSSAFGWIPGLGGKLKKASKSFEGMKNDILGQMEKTANGAASWGKETSSKYVKGVRSNGPKAQAAGSFLTAKVKEGALSEGPTVTAAGEGVATLLATGVANKNSLLYQAGQGLGIAVWEGWNSVPVGEMISDVQAAIATGSVPQVNYQNAIVPKVKKPKLTPPPTTDYVNSGASGGGAAKKPKKKPQTAAQKAAAKAKAASENAGKKLAEMVGAGFVSEMSGGTEKKIRKTTAKLIDLVKIRFPKGKKRSALIDTLKAERDSLIANGKALAANNTALEAANALRDKAREMASSVTSSLIGDLPGNLKGLPVFGEKNFIGGVKSYLTGRIAAVKSFGANIAKLKSRGLPPYFLEQIIGAGLDGADMAKALANSSDMDFKSISSSANTLASEAGKVGDGAVQAIFGADIAAQAKKAGLDLKKVGMAAADGLVAGLKSKETAIKKQMTEMSKAMVEAIKKALGIKSPSRLFRAEVGQMLPAGVIAGVRDGQSDLDAELRQMVSVPRVSSPVMAGVGAGHGGGGVSVSIGNIYSDDPVATRRQVDEAFNELVRRLETA